MMLDIQTPEKKPYMIPKTTTFVMLFKAIMDMISALHAIVDTIVIFNTPMHDAIIPAVERPIKAPTFMITI